MKVLAKLAFSTVLAVSSTAFAADLDFRSSDFAAASGQSSFEYQANDGVEVNITAGPQRTALAYDSNDGLGVTTSPFDPSPFEIQGRERLSISFSQAVHVTDVFLTDLFAEVNYFEVGSYSINGGPAVGFSQTSRLQTENRSNGTFTLHLDSWVNTLTFSAPGYVGPRTNHEFSVAGLSYDAVGRASAPELDASAAPSALALLVGMLLLAAERRRRFV